MASQLLGEVSAHRLATPVGVSGDWEPGQGRDVAHSGLLDPPLCLTLDVGLNGGISGQARLFIGGLAGKGVPGGGGHDDEDKLTPSPYCVPAPAPSVNVPPLCLPSLTKPKL